MFGMSPEDRQMIIEMHAAQIEMHTDMKWMKGKLREADSEAGYKRCVAHKAAVDTLAVEVGKTQNTFKWIKRTGLGGLITMFTVGCAAAANVMLGKG